MNRKHNPWVALVALILLATILVLACTGCEVAAAEVKNQPRFTCERAGGGGIPCISISSRTPRPACSTSWPKNTATGTASA